MSFYRNIFLSALVATAPMAASAGGLAPSVESDIAPIIIEEAQPTSSARGLIVPAILIALVAVAVASGDSDGGAKDVVTGGES